MRNLLFSTNAPRATILIRLLVGAVFLSEGIQKFLFPAAPGLSGTSSRDNFLGSIYFLFKRHTIVSGSRPLPGLMSPRCSIALMVLRLADRGRSSSLSFNRRRTGLPPSESVSSWYPSWMCESRSCSVSVSFGRRPVGFFVATSHVHSQEV
jgi:hypothetical protein